MAVYEKYKNIESIRITIALSILEKELSSSKTELSSLNSCIQDKDSCKPNAKSNPKNLLLKCKTIFIQK